MSTALLALALLIGLGIAVFLISLGLTGLGVLLSRIFPITPFQAAIMQLVLFAMAILVVGLSLLFERIRDTLGATAEEEDPLDGALGLLKHERGNPGSSKLSPFRREEIKVGRNDPCPCGSGKKFKYCCMNKV